MAGWRHNDSARFTESGDNTEEIRTVNIRTMYEQMYCRKKEKWAISPWQASKEQHRNRIELKRLERNTPKTVSEIQ